MKNRVDPMVKCPFYKFEERSTVTCEGVQEGSNIRISFASPTDRKDYEREMCCKNYKRCIWAKALLDKYEKDG